MRKKFLLIVAVLFTLSANAQNDSNMLNHLSVGLNLGTPGWGVDVAMPVGNHLSVRAGFSMVPDVTMKTDLDIQSAVDTKGFNIPTEIKAEGKVGFTNGKVLLDIYPFKNSSFFISAGAYFGTDKIVKAYNAEEGALKGITDYNSIAPSYGMEKIGVILGDYLLEPDANGNVDACIKTAGFKPYLGLGFGRSVPRSRLGFMLELGCQFWGTPKVYCFDKELSSKDLDGKGGDVLKTLSKVTAYPVINFRLCGRIF